VEAAASETDTRAAPESTRGKDWEAVKVEAVVIRRRNELNRYISGAFP
jgi:hypothetical protein